MSGGKFASLTSGLLVRKGEARPSEAMPPHAFSFAAGFAPKQTPERHSARPLEEVPPPAVVSGAHGLERPRMDQVCETLEPVTPAPDEAAAKPCESTLKPRRLMVSLSSSEHETLGLIAVKKGVTRHRLLRNALDEYLALLVDEYGDACACINSGCACASPA